VLDHSRHNSIGRFEKALAALTTALPANSAHTPGADRRARLAAAKLYLVCAATPPRLPLAELLRAAISGGVDVVQLREKHMPDEQLAALARSTQELCSELEALLIVNDSPAVALAAGADGVHVGQDDMPVAAVRELVGAELLIGLSTHSPQQIDQVDGALVDYIGVGPVHETPTKPGRPAVGLELVRYAAAHASVPFFAIGGLDDGNLADVLGAGASRVCVLRAVGSAADPERAARALRARLDDPDGAPVRTNAGGDPP
jgi:thiamine-phosphate pyrophosphorylase